MADNDDNDAKSGSGNGGAPGFGGEAVPNVEGAPAPADPRNARMSVAAQYVKDFSFENPGAPQSLMPRQSQPKIDVSINVGVKRNSTTDLEVSLKLDAKAKDGNTEEILFAAELDYCGLFRLSNVPENQVGALAMVECPRLLFPFARQVIADATRNGGFPPLLLEPFDFVALYRERLRREAEGSGPALDIAPPANLS